MLIENFIACMHETKEMLREMHYNIIVVSYSAITSIGEEGKDVVSKDLIAASR